jgi:ATP-dependent DNA helicase DinG
MVLDKLKILRVSRDRKTKELAWVWNLVPVDVQQALASLYRDYNGVVLTSATLFTDNACQDGVLPRIGWRHLDESAKTQLCLKPTFSENNVRTVLLTGIHSGKPMTCTAAEELAHCALEISRLRDGGILALFAATARVRAFGRMAKQHAPPGIRVAVQGDASRQRLTKLMRQGDIDLLVGTKSFYNGIDIPGENLSVVILDKVPFLFPSHLVKARTARVEQNGGNGFRDYILPLALIALRQGIGRLQRSESDTGVIILVADGWLDKPYSKDVERILPGTIVRISGRSSLLDAMNINQPSAA